MASSKKVEMSGIFAKPNQTDSYLSTLAVQNQHFSTFRILCAFGYSNPYVGYVRVTFSRSLTTCTSIVLVLYWYLGQDQQYSQIPENKPQQNLMSITLALMALVELRIYQLVAQSHGSTCSVSLHNPACFALLCHSRLFSTTRKFTHLANASIQLACAQTFFSGPVSIRIISRRI